MKPCRRRLKWFTEGKERQGKWTQLSLWDSHEVGGVGGIQAVEVLVSNDKEIGFHPVGDE